MFGLFTSLKSMLYALAAGVVAASISGGIFYIKGRTDGYVVCKQEQLKALLEGIEKSRTAQEQDAEQAEKDLREMGELRKAMDDVLEELENPGHECLTRAESDRLRGLWRNP